MTEHTADLRREPFDWIDDDGTVTLRFECRPRDIVHLPDGSTMFYNATVTECSIAPSAVGQVRDIFRLADGGVEFHGAKGMG